MASFPDGRSLRNSTGYSWYIARGLDMAIPSPGSENEEAALIRFRADLERAAQASPGDFAVVARGGIIAKFLQSITGVWKKPDYTEVIRLFWEDDSFYR